MGYIAFCSSSNTSMLYLYEVEDEDDKNTTLDVLSINRKKGECENCKEHLISIRNVGEDKAEKVKVFGDFLTDKAIILDINEFSDSSYSWNKENLENNFNTWTENLENDGAIRDMIRVTSSEAINPTVTSCQINNEGKDCNVIEVETLIFTFNTNSIRGGFSLSGYHVAFPKSPEEGYKSYLLDEESAKFVESYMEISTEEGYLC